MAGRKQKISAFLGLALVAVIFLAATMASNTLLRGLRLDLTEDNLYTLSSGTRELLRSIEEPINLYFFFSDRETADVQFLRSYAVRVSEILEEFAAVSNGALALQQIDPVPFSEDEDRAAQYGLTDIGASLLGDSIYFGLAATNTIGEEAIIEVFDPAKEASLEYDLARLIYSLATGEKTVVGLLSGVPMTGGFDPQSQQPMQPWTITQQVRQLFEVRELASSLTRIDDEINLLWLVHPVDLDDATLYAIDQFVMRGGRALIFVDPLAETAPTAPGPTGMGAPSSSDLGLLFDAWGIEFDAGSIVADNRYALSINTGQSPRPVRHIGYIGLEPGAISSDDLVTAGLGSINVATAGHLQLAEGASITFEPLLTSSADSALVAAARFQFLADPGDLLTEFTADATEYVLAARIQGRLQSAFPDGPPLGDSPEDDSLQDAPSGGDASAEHIASVDSSGLLVVADVDVLNDMLWVSRQRGFLGQQILTAFANNGDFISNAIGNLAGSEYLVGLKGRAAFSRPFDRVEGLRRDADARFRTTEQQLQAELSETERRLGELQAARDDSGSGSLLMTPEQQVEVDRFRSEQLRIRQELRSVRRELDSSIEGLGTVLKLTNIVIVPLALALLALVAYFLRKSRRRSAV
jgi:ABC-type uncharacterized transport system involved in gliding motility auxiliary subunit